MKALIFAAGYATRLYPLTENQPKHLLPIKGKPLLDYIIEKIKDIEEIDRIYIICNNKFYTNFAWSLTRIQKTCQKPITLVDEGSTAVENQEGVIYDAILTLDKEDINDDLLIIFGDNVFSFDLTKMIHFSKEKNASCLAAYQLESKEKAKRFGVIETDENNKMLSIKEKPKEPESTLVVTGIYVVRKEDIPKLRRFYQDAKEKKQLNPSHSMTHFFIEMQKSQDVYAFPYQGEWVDIGTMEDYERIK